MPPAIEISRFVAKFAVEGVEAIAIVWHRCCIKTLKLNLMAQPIRHLRLPVASSQDYPA
jgi:hypothetical protein